MITCCSKKRKVSPLSLIKSGDIVFYKDYDIWNDKEIVVFQKEMKDLINRVIMNTGMDALSELSLKQRQFVIRFFKEGGIVTDKIKNNEDNPKELMSDLTNQFDSFLGTYRRI